MLHFDCLARHEENCRFHATTERLEVEEELAMAIVKMSAMPINGIQYSEGYSRVLAGLTVLLGLLRVLVEQAGITDTALDRRHIRRVDVFFSQTLPSHFGEPGMIHHVATTAVQVAQTLGQIMCDELGEQVLCIRMDVRWILDATFQDVLIDFEWRASVPEGSKTTEHFED